MFKTIKNIYLFKIGSKARQFLVWHGLPCWAVYHCRFLSYTGCRSAASLLGFITAISGISCIPYLSNNCVYIIFFIFFKTELPVIQQLTYYCAFMLPLMSDNPYYADIIALNLKVYSIIIGWRERSGHQTVTGKTQPPGLAPEGSPGEQGNT